MQDKDSRDSLWAWKDVNKQQKKKKAEGEIKFKQDSRKQRLSNFMRVLGLVAIAILSGFISAYFFVSNLDNITITGGSGGSGIIERDPTSSGLQTSSLYNIVLNIAPAVVGIGESEEVFNKNPLENTNNLSGFVVRSDGYIVTNYHGVEGLEKIYVKLSGHGSKPMEAKIAGYDKNSDIALLKIDANNLTVAKLGDISTSKIGDTVMALANSGGEDYIGTVTTGIISSISKKMEIVDSKTDELSAYSLLQTTLTINNYNDGAIIVNLSGEIIGINSKRINDKYNAQGLSHAISIGEIRKIVDSILSHGGVKKPSLGFNGGTVTPKTEGDIEGVYVQSVSQDNGASKAGIKATDIIIELDGTKITKLEDIYSILERKKVGDQVSCKVWRNGEILEFTVELGEAKS